MDPFATLGLPPRFDLDPAEIERRYRDLQRAFHPDRSAGKPPAERRLAAAKAVEINEARRVLADDVARARALLALRGAPGEDPPASPELLMEAMERREALAAARARNDLAAARALGAEVRAELDRGRARLASLFAASGGEEAIGAELTRMRYQLRLLDEVDALEDRALEDRALEDQALEDQALEAPARRGPEPSR